MLALETKQKERKGMHIIHVPFLCFISFPVYAKERLFLLKCFKNNTNINFFKLENIFILPNPVRSKYYKWPLYKPLKAVLYSWKQYVLQIPETITCSICPHQLHFMALCGKAWDNVLNYSASKTSAWEKWNFSKSWDEKAKAYKIIFSFWL